MKPLKHEEVLACKYETMQDVVDRIPRFIEEIYNRRRLHSALGYLPLEESESQQTACAAEVKAGPQACLTQGVHSNPWSILDAC